MDKRKSNVRWTLAALAVAAVLTAIVLMMEQPPPAIASVKSALGLQRDTAADAPRAKPICTSPVNPNVAVPIDCIPQHLANLPPDPGPAGMKTIEGIDSDKDGVRDDVQRFIAENYGDSQRAVLALTGLAKLALKEVELGDSVSKEQAKTLAPEIMKATVCFSRSVSEELINRRASELVQIKVTNTPERYERLQKFENLLAGVYPLNTAPTPEVCGYDPALLPN
ncbi:MAG: hypothetical protein H0V16_02130 [Burkholderiaceae bacterium]|nr:hypothetical protein [Burkholderiaceae bacterium]